MRKNLVLFLIVILLAGCGNVEDTADTTALPADNATALAQDSEVSPATASAGISGSNGTYTLTYTDSQSGLTTTTPLLYDEVYENQITVIYQGSAEPDGVVYQSDLDTEMKLGLFTSDATSADAFAEDLKRLNSAAGVILAEPNYRVSTGEVVTSSYVNDPDYSSQWGLQKVNIETAWDKTTGSGDIVVAVIDTGIDYEHEDLSANIWHNTDEIAGNGVDDDHNGLVDDVMGYDFVNRDTDPMDDNKHGTHCAGIIGARSDNLTGITGISPNVSLMPLKVLAANGSGSTLNIFYGFKYAVENGARIISMSLGGYGFNYLSYYGAYYAYKNNVLVVAAAGNEANNNDADPVYPAGFPFSNIIAVASTGTKDTLSGFSNYGARSVDIAAPGEGIYSTVPGDGYASLSGTSMATPFVSGTAALVLAMDDSLSHIKAKAFILNNSTFLNDLEGKVYTGSRLDAGGIVSAPDLQKVLTVSALSPDADSTDIALDSTIRIYFNRSVDPQSVSASSLVITDKNGQTVDGTFDVMQTIVTFTPDALLEAESTYTVTLKTNLKGTDNSAMETEQSYHFTTAAASTQEAGDDTAQNETTTLDSATDVSIYAKVTFTFDAPLSDENIKDIEFVMKDSGGSIVPGKLAYAFNVLTFTPSQPLKAATRYMVTLSIASAGVQENFYFTTR